MGLIGWWRARQAEHDAWLRLIFEGDYEIGPLEQALRQAAREREERGRG